MLIKNNHNKSAQPSHYPPLLSLFLKEVGLLTKLSPRQNNKGKVQLYKAYKRQVNTRYEL